MVSQPVFVTDDADAKKTETKKKFLKPSEAARNSCLTWNWRWVYIQFTESLNTKPSDSPSAGGLQITSEIGLSRNTSGSEKSMPPSSKTPATSAFGQASFGRINFVVQTATESTSNHGPSNSSSGFANYSLIPRVHSAQETSHPLSAAPNTSSFGNNIVENLPQNTRDASMSDSTPAFVGLSLGDSSENSKPPSTFNTSSPLPLPPTHPANQLAQTSAFGSGSGNVATGFGAFGGLAGSFGVSGNTGNTTNSVSTDEQSRPGSGFG
ncbi:hypothetical protein F5877DRAFT_85928 [Lentinula edodes]|nr:hypothetical protein F5877DRAFT_85928 [Lentinula edodes]